MIDNSSTSPTTAISSDRIGKVGRSQPFTIPLWISLLAYGALLVALISSFEGMDVGARANGWFQNVAIKQHVYIVPTWRCKPCFKPLPYLPPERIEDDLPLLPNYVRLRQELWQRGYYVHEVHLDQMPTPKDADIVLFDDLYVGEKVFDFLSRFPKDRMILILREPPTVIPSQYVPEIQSYFGRLLTWDDSLVDGDRFQKSELVYPGPTTPIAEFPFDEKKLCVMINKKWGSSYPKELYSERHRVVEFYEDNHPEDFDLFGFGWRHLGLRTYRETVADKLDCLARYRFCICYENTGDIQGYVTEKILDCFVAGCVPIYLGASDISRYVPADCFIDRRQFASDEDVYRFIRAMGPKDHSGYIERARDYLVSEQAQVFFPKQYLKRVADTIDEVASSAISKKGREPSFRRAKAI